MSERTELASLARGQAISVTELARRFGVSRKTAYKWIERQAAGEPPQDRSRRPERSPLKTALPIEEAVVTLRREHPCWGGRKLAKVLSNRGHEFVPAPSTITDILRRHGLLAPPAARAQQRWQRFEHPSPNDLWQMDFKGPIDVGQGRCDPLTVLDDHSRYSLVLLATTDQRGSTVKTALTDTFRRFGLPLRMNMDNGNPWGIPSGRSRDLSTFAIWLVRVGIRLSWSAPAHPQTNGKEERFHRSFKAEVVRGQAFADIDQAQQSFDRWRAIYNDVRPHEAIGMAVPADRYHPSPRSFPEALPAIEYAPQDIPMQVDQRGRIKLLRRPFVVSTALGGHVIAARPRDAEDGLYDLYFSHQHIGEIDLNEAS
ncbi:MAG TPA: IS481 family transposase [Luteibacter sp.]|nr:IS481 family transposase [Luteibacter sp.]